MPTLHEIRTDLANFTHLNHTNSVVAKRELCSILRGVLDKLHEIEESIALSKKTKKRG